MSIISKEAADHLFTEARSHNAWQPKEIPEEMLHKLYELMKFAPTSANCSPLRIVFVKSREAKAKLKPFMSEGNVAKTMQAPVTAILAFDMDFASHLPQLFPHIDARPWFAGTDAAIRTVALRNSTIQAGFFIAAARAIGLDTGPMSGFDEAGVNAAFFAGTRVEANFLVSLGFGDASQMKPRLPRFGFDEVCKVI